MSEVEYDIGVKWYKILYNHESLMKFWCKRWDKSLMSGGTILVSEVGLGSGVAGEIKFWCKELDQILVS